MRASWHTSTSPPKAVRGKPCKPKGPRSSLCVWPVGVWLPWQLYENRYTGRGSGSESCRGRRWSRRFWRPGQGTFICWNQPKKKAADIPGISPKWVQRKDSNTWPPSSAKCPGHVPAFPAYRMPRQTLLLTCRCWRGQERVDDSAFRLTSRLSTHVTCDTWNCTMTLTFKLKLKLVIIIIMYCIWYKYRFYFSSTWVTWVTWVMSMILIRGVTQWWVMNHDSCWHWHWQSLSVQFTDGFIHSMLMAHENYLEFITNSLLQITSDNSDDSDNDAAMHWWLMVWFDL